MSNTARRTSMTYPNGRVVNLGYGSTGSIDDLFSLVKSAAISGESGNKVEYTRVGLGRYVKIAYPQPGVEMSMIRPGGGSEGDSGDPYDGYDRFSRVQEMRWQNSSTGTPIDAWQWGYNEASNRTWKKNLVAASGQDEAYGYDGLYQVIRDAVGTLNTNRTAVGGVPVEEEDFTYDPTGNWLGYRKDTNGSVVLDQSRSNNQDNQLTQINGSSALLSYDRAGNATKTAPGLNGDWSKSYQPVWDAWNRLVEVKDETGASVQKNAYDGLTRRITKESGGTVTHTYWSDRWKPLEERIGSATTAARSYMWGERPGHRDELVLRDWDTDGNGTLDERLYATMDYFNGTSVLNTSGVVQERYAYSAFGVRRIMAADFSPRSTSSYAWDFGFQGQFPDSETGWSNYGFRFYAPLLGRWISRDPIGERGGAHLYGFVSNSPVNFADFLGFEKKCHGVTRFTVTQKSKAHKGMPYRMSSRESVPDNGMLNQWTNTDPQGISYQSAPFDVDLEFAKPDCGCCEFRQQVSYSPGYDRPSSAHTNEGFDEDRGKDGKGGTFSYGHRKTKGYPHPSDVYFDPDGTPNMLQGCSYHSHDEPMCQQLGRTLSFLLQVVDTCPDNNGAIVAEKRFSVTWGAE